jgi:hypothetical protein
MIVNLVHRDGDTVVAERIDGPVVFDGGQPAEGVLVEFPLGGGQATARILKVLPQDAEDEPVIEVELIDREALDAESGATLANLPPEDDFTTEPATTRRPA